MTMRVTWPWVIWPPVISFNVTNEWRRRLHVFLGYSRTSLIEPSIIRACAFNEVVDFDSMKNFSRTDKSH